MSHPLDHALILTQIQPVKRTFKSGHRPRGSYASHGGGYSPFMIALDPRFKPNKVTLIYDRTDQVYARYIESLYKGLGIDIEHWSQNLESVEESIARLSQSLQALDKPLALCINTDQSWLSTLVSSVFQQYKYPILSCVNGSLYRLGLRPQKISLEPEIDLDHLLSSLGARTQTIIEGDDVEPHLEDLSRFLVKSAQNLAHPLAVIQRLARESDPQKLLSSVVKGSEIAIPLFQETLERFEEAGCVELNQGRLLFSSIYDRAYCASIWLVFHILISLKKLEPKIRVWAANQDVKLELAYPSPLESKIDLIAFINDQLFCFFCVSSHEVDLEQIFDDQALLVERFGAQIVFLSLDELSFEDQKRALQDKILLCQAEQLINFEAWFTELM